MAKDAPGRIIDPDGFLGQPVIDPTQLSGEASGTESTSAGNAAGNSDNGDGYARDPDGTVQRNADGSPRKKRGRKPGSGKAAGSAKTSRSKNDIAGIEKLLFSIHMMAATGLKMPELALDNEESKMLAETVQSVQDFYGFEASAEVMLWTNVIGVLGAVYGTRAMAIYKRKSKEKPQRAPVQEASLPESGFLVEGVDIPHAAPQ